MHGWLNCYRVIYFKIWFHLRPKFNLFMTKTLMFLENHLLFCKHACAACMFLNSAIIDVKVNLKARTLNQANKLFWCWKGQMASSHIKAISAELKLELELSLRNNTSTTTSIFNTNEARPLITLGLTPTIVLGNLSWMLERRNLKKSRDKFNRKQKIQDKGCSKKKLTFKYS